MRKVWLVSDLTGQIRQLLENQFGVVWVTGEVTNLRAQASGHMYFTLKDAGAQLNCVLFRGEAVAHRDSLADGQKVTANQSNPSITTGGVVEFDGISNPTVAFQGSGTANAPHLVIRIDSSVGYLSALPVTELCTRFSRCASGARPAAHLQACVSPA